jgi:hypothetical protein
MLGRHDIQLNNMQHYDTQHNGIQHKDTQDNDIQHNNKKIVTLSIILLFIDCCTAECRVC